MTATVNDVVARLDAWLETMRCPGGYGGPVAHWWRQSLLYCGPGLDWRYEGIIAGYLALWERTGEARWLEKAGKAGDDLQGGQLPDGHFVASCFELNPASGGTPHEAACDVGLLLLAQALRRAGDGDRGERYAACAERNLRGYFIAKLWDAEARGFRDDPATSSFVPNKAATACEALFLLAEVRSDGEWIERYALPNLERILAHQVYDGSGLDGAIAQNSFGAAVVEKYFPVYIARCAPALLLGYRHTGEERYAEGALGALRFIARQAGADGSLPTVVYAGGRANRHPSWIAPLADVLRAADLARPLGFDADLSAVAARLQAGQDASGGVQTATGFAGQAGSRQPALPDVRDLLHVAGWCDKVFRYWAGQAEGALPAAHETPAFEAECVFRGKTMAYRETAKEIRVMRDGGTAYLWRKGAAWAETATPEFWLQ